MNFTHEDQDSIDIIGGDLEQDLYTSPLKQETLNFMKKSQSFQCKNLVNETKVSHRNNHHANFTSSDNFEEVDRISNTHSESTTKRSEYMERLEKELQEVRIKLGSVNSFGNQFSDFNNDQNSTENLSVNPSKNYSNADVSYKRIIKDLEEKLKIEETYSSTLKDQLKIEKDRAIYLKENLEKSQTQIEVLTGLANSLETKVVEKEDTIMRRNLSKERILVDLNKKENILENTMKQKTYLNELNAQRLNSYLETMDKNEQLELALVSERHNIKELEK